MSEYLDDDSEQMFKLIREARQQVDEYRCAAATATRQGCHLVAQRYREMAIAIEYILHAPYATPDKIGQVKEAHQ